MPHRIISRFEIRNLRPTDIAELIRLPQTEGREMGDESEVLSWMHVDPFGIFVAVNVEDEEIAGCCSGIALSDNHGYIGMYIVKNTYRGVGLGRILWQAAIGHLGDRNISLSSAAKMIPFYREKAGFCISADWTVNLYETTQPYLPSNFSSNCLPYTLPVRPKSQFLQYVINYDSSIHKYDRSAIVKETVQELGTLTVISFKMSLGTSFKTTGYACMKKSIQGHWLIAPVYADDYSSATSLVYTLLSTLTDEQRNEGVVAKLVSSNHEAEKLFRQFGLSRTSYQLQRLFTKEVFEIPEKKIFALQTSVFCSE